MNCEQFENDILKPFLKIVHDNCVKEGHQVNRYPFKITIGDLHEMTICFDCNKIFQNVMIEKSFMYLDDESRVI